MQKAAQERVMLHQIDVKIVYLRVPIDCVIYMEEGYKVKSNTSEMLAYKLEKS